MDVFINQERFSAADVQVFYLGRVISGYTKISWNKSREVEGVKVVGNSEDAGYTQGNKKKSGSITLLQEEIEGIVIANGGKDLTSVPAAPMTIIMKKGPVLIKKTLTSVLLKEDGMSAEGASITALGKDIPFYFGDVITA